MHYVRQSFSLPTSNRQMTVEAYELAVGLRCPRCHELWSTGGLHFPESMPADNPCPATPPNPAEQ